jgi:hypothetical protein
LSFALSSLKLARMEQSAETQLAELAASVGPLRRVLASIAERLVTTRAHEQLCYARLSDYARERPGLSARQLQDLARVHRALACLPALERALVSNQLPWSKVRLVARVASGEDEAAWIARAHAVSTRQLEQLVRERARGDAADDLGDGEPTTQIRVRCAPAVCEKWERVREVAERVAGARLRADEVLEQVVAETLSGVAIDRAHAEALECEPRTRREEAHTRARLDARAAARRLPLPIAMLAENLDGADARELDRRLREAVRLEQTLDATIAPLLRCVASAEHEWHREYWPLPLYAREQLGMSASKARALLRLERAGDLCPELRSAHRSGRLSWVKAQCLLPLLLLDVPGEWRHLWVAWAERVTVRRLERDVRRALLLRAGHDPAWQRCKLAPELAQAPIPPGEQQMCAHDVDLEATQELAWRVPRDVAALFLATSRELTFEAMLDHVLATWLLRDPAARRPDPVIERDGYLCAVPGCTSRRNLHDHHVAFLSAGGSDAPDNRVTLCAFHHLRSLHAGRMRIRGLAPDRLIFELPLGVYRTGDVRLSPELSPEEVDMQWAA